MYHPAPHALRFKERGGGARGRMQQSVIRLPEGLGTVEWFARVVPYEKRTECCPFFRLSFFLRMGEGQNAVHFFLSSFCAVVRYALCIIPQVGSSA